MRFVFGDCTLDIERYELRRAGQVVALEPRTFRVLVYLLRHAGRAVTKQELVQACWPGSSSEVISQEYALRNCLMKIRRAVGHAGTPQTVIETVRGYGYRVTAAVTVLLPEALTAGTVPPDHANVSTPPDPSMPSQLLPGRRQLTVLRCALVEEPAWVRRDPEDVRMVLQAFYTTCEDVIQRCDGYIAQYDSAGLLVYFGYPTADEGSAPRAVRAGLMLLNALGRLKVQVAADTPMRLAVRLGIHTGLVVVDTVGVGGRQNLVALGDTLQEAARLQERAAPDTVVLSAATWHLVQGYFTGHVLGSEALADVDVSVPAYQVLGTNGAQGRLEVEAPHGLTPLVGREAELALLHARWVQARDGLGQVVVLNGEPGIGKSRLVQVFHEHLATEPHVRVEWRCAPDAQQSPLQPVIAHLHRLLRWRPEDTPEITLRTLEATLAASGLALPEVVPLLAALLSLPLPTHYSPPALTPQRQRHKTMEVLLAWLLAETAQQPVLFIVEDLHWSDPSTLEFLTLLLDQGPTARLLTLLTCRPEFAIPWSFRAHCTPLTLPRLPQAQVAEMIGGVAGNKALPPEVVAQIAIKTDGVPLFVEELTKMVLESGLLHEGEDRYALPGPLPSLAIPATLHDSLMARLDRLGPVKAVAQLGATIGRTFAYDLLRAVATADGDVVLHALAQQYLGITYQDQGDYGRAIDCLEQTLAALAGARRRELCGVDLLPAVLSRAALASCHAERGTFAAGRAVGAAGLRIAEAVAHPSSLMFAIWGLGLLALRQGDLTRALPWLEQAVDRCQEADVPGYFPRIAAALGAVYTLAGRVADAVPLLTQAWEQTMAPDMGGLQTLCGLALGEAQVRAGRLEEAHTLAEHTLALARTHQERGRQAYALHLLGDIAARRGPPEIELAETFYQQALTLAEDLGMRRLQAHCHHGLGTLYATRGQAVQACVELSAAMVLYRAMDMTFWLLQAEATLVPLVDSAGRPTTVQGSAPLTGAPSPGIPQMLSKRSDSNPAALPVRPG